VHLRCRRGHSKVARSAENVAPAERIMLREDFFGASAALSVGSQVREESKDHVLEPINVNLTLLDSKETFFGLLGDLA